MSAAEIVFQPAQASAWLDKLCQGPSTADLSVFQGAIVEELKLWPQRGRLRMTLALMQPAEETGPFDALRLALKDTGMANVELRVRYADGSASLGEYLALHFDDLCADLHAELDLDAGWVGALDYRWLDEDEPSLALLTPNPLGLKALADRKAALRFADRLAWGCGARPRVELEQSAAAMEEAPQAPSPAPAPVPVPENRPLEAKVTPKPKASAKEIPESGLVLEGRAIPVGNVKPMASFEDEAGDVSVEGEVFQFEATVKNIKGKDRLLVKAAFSDGGDSILATWWVPEGKSPPKELGEGARIRARGELKRNRFENDDLCLDIRHLVLLPPRLKREDKAPRKRVELHAHSKMSASDAMTDASELVRRAHAWGHAAVGLTDHGVVHAFPEAAKAAKALAKESGRPIKLLLGMEAYLVPDLSYFDELRRGNKNAPKPEPWHCIVYARSEKGRRALYDLVSASHTLSFYKKPLISRAMLQEKREHLVVGSACDSGELYKAVHAGASPAELERIAAFYDYLEVQPLGNNAYLLRQDDVTPDRLKDNIRVILELAKKLGKPAVATSDMHFLDPEDEIYRRVMQAGMKFTDYDPQPPLYLRTTEEMLQEFAWLEDPALAEAVVIDGPNAVADLCENVPPVPEGRFFPELEGAEESIRSLAQAKAKDYFGDPLPELVEKRLERELKAIIGNKFSVLYEIARRLVARSNERGYMVGSRGSVGSSLAAWCLNISEVNPLPAFELCPQCKFCEFREKERLSGVDLPQRVCPHCGGALLRDGHNIPFETFVGFKGDKVPDIDLNFAPEVQNEIQKYAEEIFGKGFAYKAGTISTLAEKQAFGFAKHFFTGQVKRKAEIERIKKGVEGVKRTSGQHPGGVILVRSDMDINDFTPVQYSGDLNEQGGREKAGEDTLLTTHFDYHAIDENLVKLDILGKDDGSAFNHLQALTGLAPTQVPLDDAAALALFSSNKGLGVGALTPEEKDWLGDTGAVALPEFGTANTRRMLEMTRPRNFTELIYISGLSHGTNVWAGNAELLIKDKKADLSTVISTRDDIMNTLIQRGMEAGAAFKITEKVRKGAAAKEGFTPEEEALLKETKLPQWWVESCKKIKYMFPKAHAAAYCVTAVRMAYFKAHHPEAFYSAWLTLHAGDVESDVMAGGKQAVLARMRAIKAAIDEKRSTPKEEGSLGALVVLLEALLRGIKFLPVDLYKSQAFRFTPVEGGLLPPLVSLAGLGENAALHIDEERHLAPFRSIEDLARRCGLNKTVVEKLQASRALDQLPKSDQADLFGSLF